MWNLSCRMLQVNQTGFADGPLMISLSGNRVVLDRCCLRNSPGSRSAGTSPASAFLRTVSVRNFRVESPQSRKAKHPLAWKSKGAHDWVRTSSAFSALVQRDSRVWSTVATASPVEVEVHRSESWRCSPVLFWVSNRVISRERILGASPKGKNLFDFLDKLDLGGSFKLLVQSNKIAYSKICCYNLATVQLWLLTGSSDESWWFSSVLWQVCGHCQKERSHFLSSKKVFWTLKLFKLYNRSEHRALVVFISTCLSDRQVNNSSVTFGGTVKRKTTIFFHEKQVDWCI